jgi:hypothetical protein
MSEPSGCKTVKVILEDRVNGVKWQLKSLCYRREVLPGQEKTDNILSGELRWSCKLDFFGSDR